MASPTVPLHWFETNVYKFVEFESLLDKPVERVTKIKGKCKICGNTQSCIFGIPSNIRRHVREQHRLQWDIFIRDQEASCPGIGAKTKKKSNPVEPPTKRQKTLADFLQPPVFSQALLDQKVFRYVIKEALPLSTVTKDSFHELMDVANPDIQVMGVVKLQMLIQSNFDEFQLETIESMAKAVEICLTADGWSNRRRSFLGVTGHWFDENLKRRSAALSCQRLKGRHTHDVIGRALYDVMEAYSITEKVTTIVTDNGSNFVNAFKEYSKTNKTKASCLVEHGEDPKTSRRLRHQYGEEEGESDDDELDIHQGEQLAAPLSSDNTGAAAPPSSGSTAAPASLSSGSSGAAAQEAASEIPDKAGVYSTADILDKERYIVLVPPTFEDLSDEQRFYLPSHVRCVAHTLNLLEKGDTDKAFNNSSGSFKGQYRNGISKVRALRNKISFSSVTGDLCEEILGRHLPLPNQTRWSSHFAYLSVVVSQELSLLNKILAQLKLPLISPIEIIIFKEYLLFMKPVSIALDILQGEDNCYMGCVLPVLESFKSRLRDLSLQHASNFRELVLQAIETRFDSFFTSNSYKIAAVVHPLFKLNWITVESDKLAVKALLESRLKGNGHVSSALTSPAPSATTPTAENFMAFEPTTTTKTPFSELDDYLNGKRKDLSMLSDYPNIEKVFRETNTTLPSSAPVERLFSQASIVLSLKRHRLNDLLFEHLLLLKVNIVQKLCPQVLCNCIVA